MFAPGVPVGGAPVGFGDAGQQVVVVVPSDAAAPGVPDVRKPADSRRRDTNPGIRTAPTEFDLPDLPDWRSVAPVAGAVAGAGAGRAAFNRLPSLPRPAVGRLSSAVSRAVRTAGRATPTVQAGTQARNANRFFSNLANMAGHQTAAPESAFRAGLRPSLYANPASLAGAGGWAGVASKIGAPAPLADDAGRIARARYAAKAAPRTAARWGVGTGILPGVAASLGGEIAGNWLERQIGDAGPQAFGGAVNTGSLVDDVLAGAGTGFAFGGPLGAAVAAPANALGSLGGNALRQAWGWAPTDESATEIAGRVIGDTVGGVLGAVGVGDGGAPAEEVVIPVYSRDSVGGALHNAFTAAGVGSVPTATVDLVNQQYDMAVNEALQRNRLGLDPYADDPTTGKPLPAKEGPLDPAQIEGEIAEQFMLQAPAIAQDWTAQQLEEQRQLGRAAAWQRMVSDALGQFTAPAPTGDLAWNTAQQIIPTLPAVYQPVVTDWANRFRADDAAMNAAYQRQIAAAPTISLYEQLMAAQEAQASLEEQLAAAQTAPASMDLSALSGG